MSPTLTLAAALCLPLAYGAQDYFRRGHKNYVSLMGVINILLTGSLAMMSLKGIWFAVKEASFPLVLGCLVLGSAWSANPAAKMFFCNPHVLNMALIDEKVATLNKHTEFKNGLRQTTIWLSISFFVSAIANFVLAYHIFSDIDPSLSRDQTLEVLNVQIADMTWAGYGVIALPLMIFSGVLVYTFLKRLSRILDTPIDSLMKS